MSDNLLSVTRQQLATFVKDPRTLRALELAIKSSNELLPAEIVQIYQRIEETLIEGQDASARSASAIAAVNRLAQAIELLATSPAQSQTPPSRVLELLSVAPPQVPATNQNQIDAPTRQPMVKELSDVLVTTPVAGATLVYNATTRHWTNASPVGVTSGGTGASTQFTAGSIVFAGASGVYSQNNSSLFWDNTNGRFGVQTATPNTWMTVRMSHTPPSATAYNSGLQIHDEPNGVSPHFNAGVAYDTGKNYGWIQVNHSTNGAYNLVLQAAGGQTIIGATSSFFGAIAAITAPGSKYGLEVQSNTANYYAALITNTATAGDNLLVYFGTEANGGTQRGSITYNRAGGLIAYNTTSDYRAKTILGSFADSGRMIDSVPVRFGLMNGAEVPRPMFVAHELQEHASFAVCGEKDAVDDDGNPVYQQVDHTSLVPILWAEIQSLRKRLESAGL